MFLSAASRGFSSVLDPGGRLGGLEEILGELVKNLRMTKVAYWVYVYQSSGWLRGTVGRASVLTGDLSLSYARPTADG